VQRAVAELPRGQRAAVLLFYLFGMTHAEVAAHLGIEVGAVKTRLYKARARITKLEKTVIYASAIVEGSEGTRAVDARPSDALTLAVITRTPIWVEPAVLDAVAHVTADRSSSVEEMEGASQIAATITVRCQK
jgi:bifunctional DNase/RNase